MKVLSAKKIDQAILAGDFVYIGNRQKVLGAVQSSGIHGPAQAGHVWVDVKGQDDWQHVNLTDVIIERRQKEETTTVKGKRGPRPGIRSTKKAPAQPNNGNLELEGMEVDQRKIKEIEDAEERRQSASASLTQAHEELEEAEQGVIKAMHKHGFEPKKNPVYMRNPWGGVALTETGGEVKEKVKFIKAGDKAKKKKKDAEEE